MGVTPLAIIPSVPLAISTSWSCDLMFFWVEDLVPRGDNASTKRHNNDSIELEVQAASCTLETFHETE